MAPGPHTTTRSCRKRVLEHDRRAEVDDLHDALVVDNTVVELEVPVGQTYRVEVPGPPSYDDVEKEEGEKEDEKEENENEKDENEKDENEKDECSRE